ncbi:MAG TPA: LON peptidase substrate-binding domain-containing protein [Variovorax sp.]|nr:LON peptidase substrate-binding domain-containing protein [Variovorax sp.]
MTASSLTTLPLFPLGSVLYPDGFLPLRIFELRYLTMIGQAHKAGTPFGVVGLTQGAEVRMAGSEPERFSSVGTVAEIRHFEAQQAALLQIECIGTHRFRVHSSSQLKNGLWTAEVEWLADDVALAVPEDLAHVAQALRRLVDTLEERRRAEGLDTMRLPIAQPWRFDDCGWVANRWCELLPMQPELKQRLMELDSPLMRLELVADLLARHGIA